MSLVVNKCQVCCVIVTVTHSDSGATIIVSLMINGFPLGFLKSMLKSQSFVSEYCIYTIVKLLGLLIAITIT